MNFDTVNAKIIIALNKLKEKDSDLLEINVNERTISHKLAEYLQEEFKELSVDCEYNRHEYATKELNMPKDLIDWNDTEAKTVFPDIMIHKRRTDTDNLLVIEMKKSSNSTSRQFDETKIMGLMKKPYSYKFGLFIEINVKGGKSLLRWCMSDEWIDCHI